VCGGGAGRYRGLGERLIGMQLVAHDGTLVRGLNFDYMNQVLAWQTLQDVLSTLRPMVAANAPAVASLVAQGRAAVVETCRILAVRLRGAAADEEADAHGPRAGTGRGADDEQSVQGQEQQKPGAAACGLCGAVPANSPHQAQCSHAFCYVCLASAQALAKAAPPPCPRCSAPLVGCVRLRAGEARHREGSPETATRDS
jgi:hypothetical protein